MSCFRDTIADMLTIFKMLRNEASTKGQFIKYLWYGIGEILLITFGILLALSVDNLNSSRIDKNAKNRFYEKFKLQLEEDLSVIQGTARYNKRYWDQFIYATSLIESEDRSQMDTLAKISMNLTKYSDFDRPGNIYQAIINSGQFGLLKNDVILQDIQRLEESYVYLNRMENIHYDFLTSSIREIFTIIKFSNTEVMLPDQLYSYQFQNITITAAYIMEEKDQVYKRAQGQIKELIQLIDAELGLR